MVIFLVIGTRKGWKRSCINAAVSNERLLVRARMPQSSDQFDKDEWANLFDLFQEKNRARQSDPMPLTSLSSPRWRQGVSTATNVYTKGRQRGNGRWTKVFFISAPTWVFLPVDRSMAPATFLIRNGPSKKKPTTPSFSILFSLLYSREEKVNK